MDCSPHSAHITLILCGYAVFATLRLCRRISTSSNDGEHDVISKLPDDILVSILARMPIKDSTRTSILSKRWRNLYKHVPGIEFRCSDLIGCSSPYPHNSSSIVKAVDKLLRFRPGVSHKIRSFRFCCCLTQSHTKRFEQWVRSLGKSGVEELFCQFCCLYRTSGVSFSCSLISEMPSLKALKLALCFLEPSMKVETQCKSLQILILHDVDVLPGALESILSNCSSLHTLSIDSCVFEPGCELSFSGPNLQLKFLYIVGCLNIEKISLRASNLTTFEFKGIGLLGVMYDHVPQLQFIMVNAHLQNVFPYVRGKLAEDLPQLKSLAFTTPPFLPELCEEPVRTNIFRNLRQLDFQLYGPLDMNLLSLIPFLQSCPLLQDFHMDTSRVSLKEPQEMKQDIVLLPELKKVELSGFIGKENELEFALHILKSAVNLDLMHISRGGKAYKGFGCWKHYDENYYTLDKVSRMMIWKRLQGQALSKTARLVVQYKSLHEEDRWGRSGGLYDFGTLASQLRTPTL